MVTRSRIALLGGLRIEQGERIITRFRTQKTGGLLAYLAYFREHSHPREQLIEIFWPEADPASGRNGLSKALSSLRHQLEPPGVPHGAILRADRFSVQLNPEAISTDVAEFEAARQRAARAGSTSERLLFLADAVELYAGELLPGCYEAWCLAERGHLGETYLGLLRQLVELLEGTGDLERALSYARRAVSADPLREESYQVLIRLLAAAGQPTAALRQYRELEQRLDEELGEQPSAATREIAREVERQATGHTATQRRAEEAIAAVVRQESALPARLPTGTVTFLLTDIERSTAQWERAGELFTTALSSHHTLLRRLFRRYGGYEFKEAGEGFLVAFERVEDALACAIDGQQALAEHPWGAEVGALRVRMALHTGDVELQERDYRGLVLHHASRMLGAAHGGQILCSEATSVLVQRQLEPGVRLTDLGVYRLRDVQTPERLFQVEYPGMSSPLFPPPRADGGYGRTLPLQFTRFIGREKEMAKLEELLLAEPTRLVTMTGPGGTGKSRLALELARRQLERFGGAVWFVPLADLSDPVRILDAALEALSLPRLASVEPLDQVVELLSRQPSLLILDNFEHLVAEGASFVRTLLERVPSLQCLVTSRQRLELAGEREFVVPPLQIPAGGDTPAQLSMYESVQLFIDRAQAVKPDFQVTNQNAPALAELCSRLEGIPLAIELAAARAQVLTPAQMLRQLTHRFEFLVSRKRDGAPRHQTLHAAVEWSYRLLAPDLRRFFARLSIFRGGWSLTTAEVVCAEPLALDYLAQLRECSLILAEEDGDESRFRMLETLREFAEERLEASGEAPALRREHADFFTALAAEAEPRLKGPDESEWLARLEREHDNLRAVLEWCHEAEGGAEARLWLAAALTWFWIKREHLAEARQWFETVLAGGASASAAARGEALTGAAIVASHQQDHTASASFAAEGLALGRETGDKRLTAHTLWLLGWTTMLEDKSEQAHPMFEEGLAMAQELGDNWLTAKLLQVLGWIFVVRGDNEQSRVLYRESLAHFRAVGDTSGMATQVTHLGMVAQRQRDFEQAEGLYNEALALFRGVNNRQQILNMLALLGGLAVEQDDLATAQARYSESAALARELNVTASLAWVVSQLGQIAYRQRDYEKATALHEESMGIWQGRNDKRAMAGACHGLGIVARQQGHYSNARTLHAQALPLWQELGDRGSMAGMAMCLDELAAIAVAQGQPLKSARVSGAAAALREASGDPLSPVERLVRDEQGAVLRAALGEEGFAAAWEEGQAMSRAEAVQYALEGRSTP